MAKKKSKKPSAASSTAAPVVNGDTEMADAQPPAQNNGSSSTSSANSSADPSASSSSSSSFTFQMDLDGLTPSQKAEKSKAQGNEKFKAGQYGLAVDLYTDAINLDAEEPSYYTNRAAAQMALKRYSEALADCQRAASLQAGSPQPKTLSRLARCQIALGQISEASSTLSEVLSLDSTNATAKADQARIVKINKDIEAIDREHSKKEWSYVLFGLDSLNKEIEVFPLKWKIYKVEALLGKKRVDEASSLASDLLRSHSNDPDVLWIRGQVLFSQGNAAQAVAHCQAALRNDPDHARARTLLKKVRAIESLKESGNDSFKSGKWQEAISKYSECIDVLTQDGEGENEVMKMTLLSNRATAFQKAGQNADAIKDADSILAKDAKHFKALRTRARAHFAAESYEAAIQDFANAFQEAPAGSPEERAMKTEHRQAEVALKRSKTKDYYKILQVERTATEVEIKKAYRKQSLVHHPDKGGDEEKFKEVQEAHSTLSDPQKRRRYDLGEDDNDMSGMGGMGGHGFHSHPFASHGGFGGGSPFGGGFSDGGINLEDLLNGGRRGGSGFSYNFG